MYNNNTEAYPTIVSAADLRIKRFPLATFVVPALIPTGATILAGRPKIGKSWAALEIAIAVATGGTCLGGIQCELGDVLFLALEDNERRLQARMTTLMGAHLQEWPARLCFAPEWRRADDGGLKDITAWIASAKKPRLVVVDVLAMFRTTKGRNQSHYESDYEAMKGLQRIGSKAGIGVIGITHLRKSQGESDPFEKVTGTLGLSGAADTVVILDRDGKGATLYVRGRDVAEAELSVEFDKSSCRWRVQGSADDAQRSAERLAIIEVLRRASGTLSPSEVAFATGMGGGNVRQLLLKMVESGEVLKRGRGQYSHPDNNGNN